LIVRGFFQDVLDRIELADEARIEYDRMEERLLAEVDDDTVLAASAAVATGKLAQMANGFIYDEDGQAHALHAGKFNWLTDLIDAERGQTNAPKSSRPQSPATPAAARTEIS